MTAHYSRIFQKQDDGWYYAKRGDQPQGPYPTRLSAEQALHRHIRGCQVRREHGPNLFWPRTWNPLRWLRRDHSRAAANSN
ncbi:MAG: DUF6316 family protein [Pseudomonadales bacterium]